MRYSPTEIARMIRPIAESYGIPEVYLFGSYARGDATSGSDVDILIRRSGSSVRSAFDIGELFNDLKDTFGQNVDLVTLESLDANSPRRSMRRFAQRLDSEKVLIYERH
jgi:predicted nucleotidyltransferase